MSAPRRISFRQPVSTENKLAPTRAEINFLWSFIQGSITVPETWNTLLRSYGLCERHAWMHLSIEMSFRDEYLLGPTILYAELIEKALCAASRPQSTGQHALEYALRAHSPCFLCTMNLRNSEHAGASSRSRLDRGRDNSTLRAFAGRLEPVWCSWLCAQCAGRECADPVSTACRQHLIAAMRAHMPVDMSTQRNMLQDLFHHVARYQESFLADGPNASDQDRAALIAAIGWCSGWRPLLAQLSSAVGENASP
jgi:hypothetical protein